VLLYINTLNISSFTR